MRLFSWAWSIGGLASVLAVFGGDSILLKHEQPSALMALFIDEPAHVVTGLLLLGAFGLDVLRRYWVPTLLGSVLIDADHLPQEFGKAVLIGDSPRPYTHSLATQVVLLIATCWISPRLRRYGFALAFGLATHLFRDTTEGAVSLLWPLSLHEFHLPYWAYAATMVAAAAPLIGHFSPSARYGFGDRVPAPAPLFLRQSVSAATDSAPDRSRVSWCPIPESNSRGKTGWPPRSDDQSP